MKWSEPHCFTPLSDFGSANLVRTTKIHILRFGSANQVRQKFGSGVIVLSRGHSQRVLKRARRGSRDANSERTGDSEVLREKEC